jgi:hypothetical protein
VHAVPVDDGVRGTGVLDLQHGSLAGGVCLVERLGDDAVQPGPFEALEPVAGDRGVRGDLSEMDGVVVLQLLQGAFQASPPLTEGQVHQGLVTQR